MTDKRKVFTVAHVPPGLEQKWLQHLRDFDTAHPGCHFEVMVDAPDKPLPDLIKMLQLDPHLTFTELLMRRPRNA